MGFEFIDNDSNRPAKETEGTISMPEEDMAHAEGETVSPDIKTGKAFDTMGEQRVGFTEEPSQEEIDRGNTSLEVTSEAEESFAPEKEELSEADTFFAKHDLGAVFDEYQDLDNISEVKERIMNGIKPQIDSFLDANNVDRLSETSKQNIVRVIVRNLDKLK